MTKARFLRATLLLAAACASSACVTLPPNRPRSPQDPWESWNRGVYKFNTVLDNAIARPVAKTYVKVVPQPIRTGVSNFFANVNTPTVMINDALQGKFLAAANDLGRFVLNTTVGIGGVLDPATSAGLDHNEEDFGLTLGHWGVHPGPFLELPILGPSDLRDGPAKVVDAYTKPTQYIRNTYVKYGLYLPYLVDLRTALLPLDDTLEHTFDPYAFVRDAYLARRAYLVSDGKVLDDQLVDPGADDSPAPGGSSIAPPDKQPARAPGGAAAPPGAAPPPGSAAPPGAAPPSGTATPPPIDPYRDDPLADEPPVAPQQPAPKQ
jgi:phospholipid-binding lipoprotein MlaA